MNLLLFWRLNENFRINFIKISAKFTNTNFIVPKKILEKFWDYFYEMKNFCKNLNKIKNENLKKLHKGGFRIYFRYVLKRYWVILEKIQKKLGINFREKFIKFSKFWEIAAKFLY